VRPRAKRPLESRICRKSRAADPHMCSRLSNERSNQLGNSLGHCLGNRYGKQTCQSCPTQRPHTDASCSCLTPLPHEGAPHSCVTGAQSIGQSIGKSIGQSINRLNNRFCNHFFKCISMFSSRGDFSNAGGRGGWDGMVGAYLTAGLFRQLAGAPRARRQI
jgi:hypothetical protein